MTLLNSNVNTSSTKKTTSLSKGNGTHEIERSELRYNGHLKEEGWEDSGLLLS